MPPRSEPPLSSTGSTGRTQRSFAGLGLTTPPATLPRDVHDALPSRRLRRDRGLAGPARPLSLRSLAGTSADGTGLRSGDRDNLSPGPPEGLVTTDGRRGLERACSRVRSRARSSRSPGSIISISRSPALRGDHPSTIPGHPGLRPGGSSPRTRGIEGNMSLHRCFDRGPFRRSTREPRAPIVRWAEDRLPRGCARRRGTDRSMSDHAPPIGARDGLDPSSERLRRADFQGIEARRRRCFSPAPSVRRVPPTGSRARSSRHDARGSFPRSPGIRDSRSREVDLQARGARRRTPDCDRTRARLRRVVTCRSREALRVGQTAGDPSGLRSGPGETRRPRPS